MRKIILPILVILFAGYLTPLYAGFLKPVELRCEYLPDPSVVDVLNPRLSWINEAVEQINGLSQVAYEIQVAGSLELLRADKADFWKTGKVKSSQ